MIGLILALGFVPFSEQVQSGPPAPHLARTPDVQTRLSGRPAWSLFKARWGGSWGVRWDQRTGAPRVLMAPGIDGSQVEALVRDVAHLAGVDPSELRLQDRRQRGERQILRWARSWRGVPVEGDQVAVLMNDGRIGGIWVQLSPVGLQDHPRPGELVLPVPVRKGPGLASTGVAPVLVTRTDGAEEVVYRDRQGRAVLRFDPRHWTSAEITHEERTVDDPLVTSPLRGITVEDSGGTVETTAADGTHGLSGDLSLRLEGPELALFDDGDLVEAVGTDDVVLAGGEDVPLSVGTVHHHTHVVRDWLEARWPTHAWLPERIRATVEISSRSCNAYYTGGTINFLVGDGNYCNNFGQIADVVYHEYGHGTHHYILAAGTFAGDVSEGSADYISASILDDPVLAPNALVSGGYIREIETDRVYPDDAIGQVHNDGLIWASFMWNLRGQWSAEQGAEDGVLASDLLFLGALEQGPTLTDIYEAVLMADDDNGDLSDGTPHACDLVTLLHQHGLGPGPIGAVRIEHSPIQEASSWDASYPVEFDLYDLTRDCSGLDADSVRVWFTTGEAPAPGTPGSAPEEADSGTDSGGDTGDSPGDAYAEWTGLHPSASGSAWSVDMPRQLATSTVRYFIEARSLDGDDVLQTHGGQESGVYSFIVGDFTATDCQDFETGFGSWSHGTGVPGGPTDEGWVDQWEAGAPVASTFGPDAPHGGSAVGATNLGGDYLPNNQQFLQTPPLDVPLEGRMPMLRFWRWLSVEDALYDRAELQINGELAWRNLESEGGDAHTLDGRWTLHTEPLTDWVDEAGQVQLMWTLRSDQGLEYGGWALDDVCISELDDVAGHYRVRDLSAVTEDLGISLTWTQPWIAPLGSSVLVRRSDDWPSGPQDGVVIAFDNQAEPGTAQTTLDTDVQPGEDFYYAVFVAETADGSFYDEVVEGENGVLAGVPAPEPPDTGEPEPDEEEGVGQSWPAAPSLSLAPTDPGCGCAGAGTQRQAGWLLLGLPLLALRRRRS